MQKSKNFNTYNFILALILILQIGCMIFYGYNKTGFHEDEYYSYFSSNRSLGLYNPDRQWQSAETIKDEFTVKSGEGFNYKLLSLVQSWDVHPPLYYDILHTVCSLNPGVFSKWLGIWVNIIAFVICFVLLYELAKTLGMDEPMRVLLLIAFGFNPMTISCVMFIRMYMWLTVFVLASALIHMKLIEIIKLNLWDKKKSIMEPGTKKIYRKYLLTIGLVNFLGFMTQYYYLIFMVMMGFFFCLWLLLVVQGKREPEKSAEGEENKGNEEKKKIGFKACIKYTSMYVLTCALSLLLDIFVYPSSLSHIFRGYRGKEAAAEFTSASNLFDRTGFFAGLVNDYLFSGYGIIILLIALLAAVGFKFLLRIKKEKDTAVIAQMRILIMTVICYFFIVAKSALLLGNTSNRYEMPVYPLILLIAVYFVRVGIRVIVGNRKLFGIGIPLMITAIIFSVVNAKGLIMDKNVLFLYPEGRVSMEFAKEMADKGYPLVIAYNDATPDNIWRMASEIMQYPESFYISEGNTDVITDEKFATAESFAAYIADNENKEEVINNLFYSNLNVTEYEIVSTKDMWTLYRFY